MSGGPNTTGLKRFGPGIFHQLRGQSLILRPVSQNRWPPPDCLSHLEEIPSANSRTIVMTAAAAGFMTLARTTAIWCRAWYPHQSDLDSKSAHKHLGYPQIALINRKNRSPREARYTGNIIRTRVSVLPLLQSPPSLTPLVTPARRGFCPVAADFLHSRRGSVFMFPESDEV